MNALEVVASEKREIAKFPLPKKFSPFKTGKKKMPLQKRVLCPNLPKKRENVSNLPPVPIRGTRIGRPWGCFS